MKFGLLFELQVPKPWNARSDFEIFHQAADQAVLAEQMGFEYIWAVEHHFLEQFAHCAAPEVWLGHLSARTSAVRLGFGVILTERQINHPVRIAERVAVLDVMSNGRVDWGTGRASNPYQLEPFGVNLGETRQEWEEVIEIVPKMWTQNTFSHKGRFWDIHERNVVPKPIQKPHPPVWVAAQQPATFDLAGRKGIGALCFAVGVPGELEERIKSYKKAIETAPEQVGLVKNNHCATFTIAYCDESDQAARELAGPQAMWYLDTIEGIYGPVWKAKNLSEVPDSYKWHATNNTPGEQTMTKVGKDYNTFINNGSFAIGNPDNMIKTLEGYEAAGADQVILFMQAGRMSHDKLMRSLKLIGKYVLPHFQEKAKKKQAAKAAR